MNKYFWQSLLYCAAALISFPLSAQSKDLAPYTIEVGVFAGINLPYDLWGSPGSLSVLGTRAAYSFNPSSALVVGLFVHHADPDRVYTTDLQYRFELDSNVANTFFEAGLHYSLFNLELDYDSDGNCVPANCQTDSGAHYGFTVGGGVQVAINPNLPLKLAMRFYKNPQLWLLLEAGIAYRF